MKNHWLKQQPQVSSTYGAGFPSDDANALQQMASGGDCILDHYYNLQFVQNEVLNPIFPCEKRDNLTLDHVAVERTMTGTIHLNGKAIQTFVHHNRDLDRQFLFQDIYASKVKVTSIRLNIHTGEISFVWNEKPGDHNYVVSYEYNMECEGFDPNQ